MISVAATILVAQLPISNTISWQVFKAIGSNVTGVISHIPLFSTLIFPTELVGMFTSIFLGMALLTVIIKIRLLIKQKALSDYEYVDGPKLLENDAAIRDARKKIRNEPSKPTLYLHPKIRLTDQLEAGNILIEGQSGVGKSTIFKLLARQVYSAQQKSFTYDEKGEYQAIFRSHNSICLKLTKGADFFWDIGKDLTSEYEASLIANSLIEEEGESQRFFSDAARQIFKSVIIFLIKNESPWSWHELASHLFTSDEKLKSLLEKVSDSAAILIAPGSKTTMSIRSLLSTKLFWLKEMAELQQSARSSWSISELLDKENDKSHIFFRPNYASPDLSRSVCNSLITLLIERWMEREDSDIERFWMLLDELGNLPENPSLIRWLSLSRAKGGRTVATAQDLSQLYESYGEYVTDTILSLFRTVIIMRLGASGPSAQKASDLLGQQRVVTLNQSLSEDQKISISTQYHDRAVVPREEIINLPSADKSGVVGFLFIGGLKNIYKLKWPYLKLAPVSDCEEEQIEPIVTTEDPETNIETNSVNRLNKRITIKKSAIGGQLK
jgi:energy-coupling factor transporter ATP-binding protein EcfA2